MKSSNAYNRKGAFGLLLIGPPKAAKTSLALTFPKPYVLDCDNNLAGAIRRMPKDFTFNYDSPNEVKEEEKRWKACCDYLKDACASPDVETIIIDSLSTISTYLITAILHDAGNDALKLRIAGEPVMQQQYWTPFRNRLAQLIMACRNSGKFFIVTCHEQLVTNEDGAVIAYRPLIPGQLRDNLAGFFSDCWRCEAQDKGGKAVYSVRFAPRNLMQIGNSLNIPQADMDLTNKTPAQIWAELGKFF
jgi:hypothetical protein